MKSFFSLGAITGTVKGSAYVSSAKAACSNFMKATVYPGTVTKTTSTTIFPSTRTSPVTGATVTQTSTVYPFTSTSFITVATDFKTVTAGTVSVVQSTETDFTTVSTATLQQKRATSANAATTVSPTIPALFSASAAGKVCTGGRAQYSSACSCYGYTATTITMPTPTTTVTNTYTGTASATSQVTATTTKTISLTTTISSFVTFSTTASVTLSIPVTTTTTSSLVATTTGPAGGAYCANGSRVNGLSPACATAPCAAFNLRIEGASDTVYEGPIYTGPKDITTPSGGTHRCDGTNGGANPSQAGTGITCLADAGSLCGFTFDGTFSSSFSDFFITRIGVSDSNDGSNRFWGILLNYQFTPVGGCQTEPPAGSDLLWAYDAFSAQAFLKVSPATANVQVGSSTVFTVIDGTTGNPVQGASFNGLTTDANGHVNYVATVPGTSRVKATKSGSIRSNAAIISVTA